MTAFFTRRRLQHLATYSWGASVGAVLCYSLTTALAPWWAWTICGIALLIDCIVGSEPRTTQ